MVVSTKGRTGENRIGASDQSEAVKIAGAGNGTIGVRDYYAQLRTGAAPSTATEESLVQNGNVSQRFAPRKLIRLEREAERIKEGKRLRDSRLASLRSAAVAPFVSAVTACSRISQSMIGAVRDKLETGRNTPSPLPYVSGVVKRASSAAAEIGKASKVAGNAASVWLKAAGEEILGSSTKAVYGASGMISHNFSGKRRTVTMLGASAVSFAGAIAWQDIGAARTVGIDKTAIGIAAAGAVVGVAAMAARAIGMKRNGKDAAHKGLGIASASFEFGSTVLQFAASSTNPNTGAVGVFERKTTLPMVWRVMHSVGLGKYVYKGQEAVYGMHHTPEILIAFGGAVLMGAVIANVVAAFNKDGTRNSNAVQPS